jgi:hypothetical protein
MNKTLRKDAEFIIENSIKAVLPDEAVKRALSGFPEQEGKLSLLLLERRHGRWLELLKRFLLGLTEE